MVKSNFADLLFTNHYSLLPVRSSEVVFRRIAEEGLHRLPSLSLYSGAQHQFGAGHAGVLVLVITFRWQYRLQPRGCQPVDGTEIGSPKISPNRNAGERMIHVVPEEGDNESAGALAAWRKRSRDLRAPSCPRHLPAVGAYRC